LALPKAAELWSLTSLREKLIKIGAKVVSHGRYRHLPDGRARGIATNVRRHSVADRPVAGAARAGMTERSGQMRQADDGRGAP
jgi:hypothetical protein